MPVSTFSAPPSPPPARYSLDDLASLAGLTARTVRFYIQQGLIDRPGGEKRGAYYLARHLEQLLLVRRWTEAGLCLDRIRELIAGSPADAPPRASRPGMVEVWGRVTLADGLEVPPRQNSCRLHRPTQGAAMKDGPGSRRTHARPPPTSPRLPARSGAGT
ncbi:MAG: MerR family transcriptional regulator [Burkholderiaceae bacterium]|nr:MerR family transcriptional regulator [Burkholderiaceae bacterium]